ncbi:MAG: PDZ domain-containing protein [Planctomycetaceae bacterium]|nr:PDZ domain-containing protein [Planctomycetaceae bacterium]
MKTWFWTVLFSMLTASSALAQDAPAPETARRVIGAGVVQTSEDGRVQTIVVSGDSSDGEGNQGIFVGGPVPADVLIEASPYWIGLGCGAATEALRAQLGLKDVGVVVFHVAEKSPAQAAGFQQHDVVIKAIVGELEIPLLDAPDLVRAVKESRQQPFKVDVLRAGKALTLSVTPDKRPQEVAHVADSTMISFVASGVVIDPEHVQRLLAEQKYDQLRAYIEKQAQAAPHPTRMRLTGPVVTHYPPTLTRRIVAAELPENMTITITKQGKQPAEIKVERGEDWWKAKENELATFPEEIRGYVHTLLQHLTLQGVRSWSATHHFLHPHTAGIPPMAPATPLELPFPPATSAPPAAPRRVSPAADLQQQLERQQKQLDAVLEQIKALQKSLEHAQPR